MSILSRTSWLAVGCALVVGCLPITSFAAETKSNWFHLVHWNILKKMYQVNSCLMAHEKATLNDLKNDKVFMDLVTETFTPDSYVGIVDQNGVFHLHPDKSLLGKQVSNVGNKDVVNLVQTAIRKDTCTRGFYIWIDNQEKYLVASPMVGKTADGYKLYYIYTMYTRSMPEYYLRTLKESVQE